MPHKVETGYDPWQCDCYFCNHYKGPNISGIDNATSKTVPLFNPRRQKWARHFRWEGSRLVGRTAAGRATVATLRINLRHRVAHRQMLITGVQL
jgi:hypothetical protein